MLIKKRNFVLLISILFIVLFIVFYFSWFKVLVVKYKVYKIDHISNFQSYDLKSNDQFEQKAFFEDGDLKKIQSTQPDYFEYYFDHGSLIYARHLQDLEIPESTSRTIFEKDNRLHEFYFSNNSLIYWFSEHYSGNISYWPQLSINTLLNKQANSWENLILKSVTDVLRNNEATQRPL